MVQWSAPKPAVEEDDAPHHDEGPVPGRHPRKAASTKLAAVAIAGAFLSFIFGSCFLIFSGKVATHPAPVQEHAQPDNQVTGRIVVREGSGCRIYGFNNNNGRVSEAGLASCGGDVQSQASRLEAIRGSFVNR